MDQPEDLDYQNADDIKLLGYLMGLEKSFKQINEGKFQGTEIPPEKREVIKEHVWRTHEIDELIAEVESRDLDGNLLTTVKQQNPLD